MLWDPDGLKETDSPHSLYNVAPNPSRQGESCAVSFNPVQANVRIILFDVAGRIVNSMKASFSMGYNSATFNAPAAGVYHVLMTSGGFRASLRFSVID